MKLFQQSKLFLTVFILIHNYSFSQKKLGNFENSLKQTVTALTETFSVPNKKTGKLATFIADKTNLYGYLLNDQFQVIDRLKSQKNKRKYKELIGSISDEKENYLVVHSNESKNQFVLNKLSFQNNTSEMKEKGVHLITFNLENFEVLSPSTFTHRKPKLVFLQSASTEKYIHLIFAIELTSKLAVLSFDIDGNQKTQVFDFWEEDFFNDENKKVKLYDILYNKKPAIGFTLKTNDFYDMFKITMGQNKPLTIENSSCINKLYTKDERLIFAFDKNKNHTQIVDLDLTTGTYKFKKIEKPLLNTPINKKKTNSLIFEDHFISLASTKDMASIEIRNLDSHELIKEYSFNINEPIAIKNTPLIQRGGTYEDYRELGSNKKFLRKLYASRIGISVSKKENNYIITIGGVKINQKANGGLSFGASPGGMGINITTFMTTAQNSYFNDYAYSFGSHYHTKSTYFKGLFDSNFNHIEGEEVKSSVFDKMKEYIKFKRNHLIDVTRYNNKTIMSCYHKKKKICYFYEFE